MELQIEENDYNMYDNIMNQPENRKTVTFQDNLDAKTNNKIIYKKQPIVTTYDEILSKMGMFVHNGKLHLLPNQTDILKHQQPQQNQPQQNQLQQNQLQQNQPQQQNQNYIYNKYFKNELKSQYDEELRQPKTTEEYKQILMQEILQKQRIHQIKSRRLIMPTSNINISQNNNNLNNLNKLFHFSQR